MAKVKDEYPEIKEIRHDLDSLKNNVVELTRHVQENGKEQAHVLKNKARKQVKQFQTKGKAEIAKLEKHVKEKPMQGLAVAFGAGLIASLLMRRRG